MNSAVSSEMRVRRGILNPWIGLLLCLPASAGTQIQIEPQVALNWPTTLGHGYQLQAAEPSGPPWINLGNAIMGDGSVHSWIDPIPLGQRLYQVVETIPGTESIPELPLNGGFETENAVSLSHWTSSGNQLPTKTSQAAHSGNFSARSALANAGANPAEGGLSQHIAAQSGNIVGGASYDFSFWVKQISSGPSYLQQYQVQWFSASDAYVGGSGLINFNGVIGSWSKISNPKLVAPASAAAARISFRFVTGAVLGGHGEVLIDDVLLHSQEAGGAASPEEIREVPLTGQALAKISWLSKLGTTYQPLSSQDLMTWTEAAPSLLGDGLTQEIRVPMTHAAEFFRLRIPAAALQPPTNLRVVSTGTPNSISLAWDASPSEGITGYRIRYGLTGGPADSVLEVGTISSATLLGLNPGASYQISVTAITATGESPVGDATLTSQAEADSSIVALYNSNTILEPEVTYETSTARVTHLADRARDRHARESQFHSYDHYLSWYWEQRVANVEIIDRVAKGGTGITFNFTTHSPLNPAEFRAFYRGIGTVAEYHYNAIAALTSTTASATPGETDYRYSATLSTKLPENRALRLGDRVEVEISQFLLAPRNGRANYYGTTFLYIVGQGIVPWYGSGPLLDSFPLPEIAWLGGHTTLPYQYSNEPEHSFKQTAGNISPVNGGPFMLGRRLHHTDFGSGVHTEPGNPIFSQHVGKLGPKFVARSCVDCHVNNGRSLPPDVGAPLLQSVVKLGSDASGTPHPQLGSELQPKSVTGVPEGSASIAGYTIRNGSYGDGTPYSLRKPTYAFQGTIPSHFSVRSAPALVGMGLLEAVAESTILALADPNDANGDGISGRALTVPDPSSGVPRLGRFTHKAAQPKVVHQIAYALNHDMSITTALFPVLDGETVVRNPEISATELDQMNRYVSLLGVGARRELTNPNTLRGEQFFQTASCTSCHSPELTTSPHHPMAELRNQTIRPYTDLLLHDMGEGLADNMGEHGASGAEWRTAPLWNIGLTKGVSGGEAYLHDGRARTLEEAILWHGGEAEASKEIFRKGSAADRAALIEFLKSL